MNRTLRDLMVSHLNLEELHTLFFYLEEDIQELPRDLGKSGIIEWLITHSFKQNKLAAVVAQLQEMRPDVVWPPPTAWQTVGQALGRAPHTRLPFEPETIIIPAGSFVMGRAPSAAVSAHETPAHTLFLPPYALGRTPITNGQYAPFLAQTPHHPAPKVRGAGWLGRTFHPRVADDPVRGVSWEDGVAYCAWLSAQTGRLYRLPTEAEWEKGARGDDGRLYPWGHEWDDIACAHGHTRPSPVTAHPAGASPYGCLDMVGNVWEWTSTCWGNRLDVPDFAYPYTADDGRETPHNTPSTRRVLRGGAYNSPPHALTTTHRDRDLATSDDSHYGLRVVLEL